MSGFGVPGSVTAGKWERLGRMTAQEAFDDVARNYEGILRRGQMMGRPVLYLDRRMVACLDGGFLGIRLGRDHPEFARALEMPGAGIFSPGDKGRQFKDWVGIPADQSGSWERYIAVAISTNDAAGGAPGT